MLALQHRDDADRPDEGLLEARAEVERLAAGLPRALLAATPAVLRSVAERAACAEASVQRWEARVGDRPMLEPDADAAVIAARAELEQARADHVAGTRIRTRLMAKGNAAGVSALGIAGLFIAVGWSPMDAPVTLSIAAAPIGPVVAGWFAAQRSSESARRVGVAKSQWIAALEATGLETMGALAARRLAVRGWERRTQEAAAVEESARPHMRAWYRLAGPGNPPSDVDAMIERVDALRLAQIHLLGLLLHTLVEDGAMDVLKAPEGDGPPRFLEDALARLRKGGALRLFRVR